MAKGNGYDFTKALRGYNTEEVDEYIDTLKSRCTSLEEDNELLSEKASSAKAALDESNTKRGLAEKELAEAESKAEEIIADAKQKAEQLLRDAASKAAKIESDAKIKADETIGAALIEEKRINAEMERKIVEKERIYNAFCDKVDSFKNSIFAQYMTHISSLEAILANKVEYSYDIPTSTAETLEAPEKPDVPREEIIEPIPEPVPVPESEPEILSEQIEKLGITVTRETPAGEKVSGIMRELDSIKKRIDEKEKKKY